MPKGFPRLTALSNIRDDRRLSKHAKLVVCMLISHADNKGECYPGLDTLAAECKMARSCVSEALDEIEALGETAPVVVRRQPRAREDGARGRTSNLYVLTLPLFPPSKLKSDDLIPPSGTNSGDLIPKSPPFDSGNGGYLIPPGGEEAIQEALQKQTKPDPKGNPRKHSAAAIDVMALDALIDLNAGGRHRKR